MVRRLRVRSRHEIVAPPPRLWVRCGILHSTSPHRAFVLRRVIVRNAKSEGLGQLRTLWRSPMKVKVKICGLTTPEAVDAAVKGGASHVGFVFSRQPLVGRVSVEQAAELAARVPGHVRKVGVFFEQDSIFFITAISAARLHILQLHDIDPRRGYSGLEGRSAWGVVPVRTAKDLRAITQWRGDWELLRGVTHPCPWTLGGGLDQTNVADAIAITGARMIDVSAGVESAPGIKDPAKISALLDVVRNVSPARS
jgi:phosphoribosylanthranilate isomerase